MVAKIRSKLGGDDMPTVKKKDGVIFMTNSQIPN